MVWKLVTEAWKKSCGRESVSAWLAAPPDSAWVAAARIGAHLGHRVLARVGEAVQHHFGQALERQPHDLNVTGLSWPDGRRARGLEVADLAEDERLVKAVEGGEHGLAHSLAEEPAALHPVRGEGLEGFVEEEERAVQDEAGLLLRGLRVEAELDRGEEGGGELLPGKVANGGVSTATGEMARRSEAYQV
jgi:hypothetical protein